MSGNAREVDVSPVGRGCVQIVPSAIGQLCGTVDNGVRVDSFCKVDCRGKSGIGGLG